MPVINRRISVDLPSRGYEIEIGSGNLASIGQFVASLGRASRVFIVTDQTVGPLYASGVAASFKQIGAETSVLSVPPGEKSKSIEQAQALWHEMLRAGADRKSIVVALGGGVVGDLAGFVAATFARGVRFIQIPTTLLAYVDSSVGGKVGVNLPGAKNMVGAFWQPLCVLIDTDVLESLPPREYRAGRAEVVKYGVILDEAFFGYLETQCDEILHRDSKILREVVLRCCRLKADVVEKDEREETGLRSVLNYGHTFCHALEAATGYGKLLHGEAVSIGMLCASRLAERLGRIGPEVTERQQRLLAALGLVTTLPSDVSHDALIDLMSHDKKVEHGKLRFVLPSKIGHVELVDDVSSADVRVALELSMKKPEEDV